MVRCAYACECGCRQRCRLDDGHDYGHRYHGSHAYTAGMTPQQRIARAAQLGVGLRLTADEAAQVAACLTRDAA